MSSENVFSHSAQDAEHSPALWKPLMFGWLQNTKEGGKKMKEKVSVRSFSNRYGFPPRFSGFERQCRKRKGEKIKSRLLP